MAVDRDILVFSVDGVLLQCKLASDVLKEGSSEALAVQAIMASTMTLRALITEGMDTGEDVDGCPHPPAALERQLVGGGHYVITCSQCNEIVEQG